ncbi:MAG: hypothetical protein R3F59_20440 [Myxococcota bacterium]
MQHAFRPIEAATDPTVASAPLAASDSPELALSGTTPPSLLEAAAWQLGPDEVDGVPTWAADANDTAATDALAQLDPVAATVLADLQAEVAELQAAGEAGAFTRASRARDRIAALLAAHDDDLDTFLHVTLAAFPDIAAHYQAEIDALLAAVDQDVTLADQARHLAEDELVAEAGADIAASAASLDDLLDEVAIIATCPDVETLAARFGITFSDDAIWATSGKDELTVLAAILTEHALRAAATDGQLDDYALGEGFDAVFGGVAMEYVAEQEMWDGRAIGAHTRGSSQIDWYDAGLTQSDGSYLNNVLHELGHVFDNNVRLHGRIDAGVAFDRQSGDAGGLTHEQNTSTSGFEHFGDLFGNWVSDGFRDNEAGDAMRQWMVDNMWGPAGGPQAGWGWADIAIDRNSGQSRWVPPRTTYTVQAGDVRIDVATYYGVTVEALDAANEGERWVPGAVWTIPGRAPNAAAGPRRAEPE